MQNEAPPTVTEQASMTTTTKNTQAEIIAEAQSITTKERVFAEAENSALILALRTASGLQYNCCVKNARYQLEIIDRSGKNVKVIPVSEFMPFYEFNEFLRNFKHA
jgi:hypothetical protein